MRCLPAAVLFAAVVASTACAPRVPRPLAKLGQVEQVHTKSGRYDGYTVKMHLDQVFPEQGLHGFSSIEGHGSRPMRVRPWGWLERNKVKDPSPGLRIDSPIMFPEDPRGAEFLAGRIHGLDYEYMKSQGWLFERCSPGFSEFCGMSGTTFRTPSYQTLDAFIAYLGRWLKEGDYAGRLDIEVVRHLGAPEQIQTRMGTHDGYTVAFCKPEENPDRRLIVLTGQGSRVFAPYNEGQPEDIMKRGNTAVLVGRAGHQDLGLVSMPGCYTPYAVLTHVTSFEELDEAIARWGRLLKEGDHQGEVMIGVRGPYFFYTQ